MIRATHNREDPKLSSPLIRWSGLGAVLAGVLFAAWGYIDNDDASSYFAVIEEALSFIVPILWLVGLGGLYAQCGGREGRAGRLGEVGFNLGFLASVLGVYNAFSLTLNWLVGLFAGLTLLGIATIRTKALGAWRALPLAMGLFGWGYYFTDSNGLVDARSVHVVCGVLFSLGWVALGYVLWSGRAR